MPLPLGYNVRSVVVRWSSAVVTVVGIAGTVGVFVAMLSLAQGFRATLVASGSPDHALVRSADAVTEMTSAITPDALRVIQDEPNVARDADGPFASPEVVLGASMPMSAQAGGSEAIVLVRGILPRGLVMRRGIRLVDGRFFRPGLYEVVAGRNASASYAGLHLGESVRIAGSSWTVVGLFDAGGSAFDSEVWADPYLLNQAYERPSTTFNSVTVRLTSPDAFAAFRDAVSSDPRLQMRVEREAEYYENQSRNLFALIMVLGTLVAVTMGVGSILGALNTMYAAVAERSREIATIRALGFGPSSVVVSFLIEAVIIALVGGLLGCAAVLPFNNYAVGALNLQTFTHVGFGFRVTPDLLLAGMGFALVMGVIGGVPPSLRAARSPIAGTLRQL